MQVCDAGAATADLCLLALLFLDLFLLFDLALAQDVDDEDDRVLAFPPTLVQLIEEACAQDGMTK